MFKENISQSRMYIAYKIGKGIYASQSSEVRKILDVNLLQGSGGFTNFLMINGVEIPVLNLYDRLNQEKLTNIENKSVIILRVSFRETYSLIALLVDEVISLFDVYDSNIQVSPLVDESYYNDYIEGYYPCKSSVVKLINIKKLINTDDSIVIRTWNKKRKLILVN